MADIDDGGPAFPGPDGTLNVNGDFIPAAYTGMALRDYFIAHAPADPQPWFRPAMPDTPAGPSGAVMDELATAARQAIEGICIGVVGAVLLMAGMAAMGIWL